jgi:hypothetical protein
VIINKLVELSQKKKEMVVGNVVYMMKMKLLSIYLSHAVFMILRRIVYMAWNISPFGKNNNILGTWQKGSKER